MALVKVKFKHVQYGRATTRYGQPVVLAEFARRGDIIDVTDEEELQKFRDLGAVIEPDEPLPPMIGESGNTPALSTGDRANMQSDGTDPGLGVGDNGEGFENLPVSDWSDTQLEGWVGKHNVTDVVSLAQNNAEHAERILDAEQAYADNNDREVRVGVENGVQKVIDEAE